MSKGFLFCNELTNEELNKQNCRCKDAELCLTEQDFYPPSDNRAWKSNVKDIDDENNFADFCVEFFEILDEEEYYDN